MNNEQFEKEARKILHRQPPEKVEMFLSRIDFEGETEMAKKVDQNIALVTDKKYKGDAEKCLQYIKRINKRHNHAVSEEIQEHFLHVINWLEGTVERKKPSKFSDTEYMRLAHLQRLFIQIFPERSSKFSNKQNIISKLGELLLERKIPTNLDQALADRKGIWYGASR